MAARKSEGEQAEEQADYVESGPADPTDIFAMDPFASQEQDEETRLSREEDRMDDLDDAIDFGEFADTEIVEELDSEKRDKKKKKSKDEEDEGKDDEDEEDEDAEDEEESEDEDEVEEDEEDEEESEEESELVKALQAQNDSLNATLQAMQAQLAELSKATLKQEAEEEEEDTGPHFNFGVPDEFVAGIASGEPDQIRKTLAAFANGVAESARRKILADGREVLEKRLALFEKSGEARTAAQKEQEAVTEDFYGTYPRYSKMGAIVALCAQEYFKKTPGATWGPVARDAIAASVKGIVKFDGKADSAKANRKRGRKTSKQKASDETTDKKKAKSKKSAGSRPPRQIKAGTRVAEAFAKRKDRQEDISDTFADFRR
jgi:hypothetical protein